MTKSHTRQEASGRLWPPMVFALLTTLMVLVSPNVLADGDTFTHIAAGGWMLDHRVPLAWDPFTSTFAGQPWVAHEWLAEVLLGAAYRGGGLTGVVLLTAAAVSVAFANLARHVGAVAGHWATMLLVTAALVCAMPTLSARPHVLALPILELWVAGLLQARRERREPSAWLLPMMAVWANMHGGFAFGLVIAAALAVEASLGADRSRRQTGAWWLFMAGAVFAALLTPQGLHGLVFPIQLLGLQSLSLVDEWRPMVLSQDWAFEGVVLTLIALLGTGRVRLSWFRLLLLVGLLHLALAHTRHGMLFGVAGALLLAQPVGRAFGSTAGARTRAWPAWPQLGWAGMVLATLVIARVSVPVAMANGRATPVDALAQVPAAVVGAPMLNSNQFGGYLALSGLHPFIDGRLELFGDAFVAEYLAMEHADGRALQRGIAQYDFRWAMLSLDDPLIARFDALPGWRRAFADDVAVVFVRG